MSAKLAARKSSGKASVGTLTGRVNGPDGNDAVARSMEALAAADIYAARLVAGLREAAGELRAGDTVSALQTLSGAIGGIRCLADILAAVGRATGVDTPPDTDHELGCLALGIQRLTRAQAANDVATLVAVIEGDLVPSLTRLCPTFPHMEARVAALA